jgi:hypothetical protein
VTFAGAVWLHSCLWALRAEKLCFPVILVPTLVKTAHHNPKKQKLHQ